MCERTEQSLTCYKSVLLCNDGVEGFLAGTEDGVGTDPEKAKSLLTQQESGNGKLYFGNSQWMGSNPVILPRLSGPVSSNGNIMWPQDLTSSVVIVAFVERKENEEKLN